MVSERKSRRRNDKKGGEWSRVTEERETGRERKSLFPDEEYHLLDSRYTVTLVPWIYRHNDAAQTFIRHPSKCSYIHNSTHVLSNVEMGLIQPALPKTPQNIYVCMYRNTVPAFSTLFIGRTYRKQCWFPFFLFCAGWIHLWWEKDALEGSFEELWTLCSAINWWCNISRVQILTFSLLNTVFYLLPPPSVYKLPSRSGQWSVKTEIQPLTTATEGAWSHPYSHKQSMGQEVSLL